MSLAVKATRSATWMIAAGLATRVLGAVGTLLLVRYVTPGEYGAAIVATIAIGTASTFCSLGMGQFVIVKGDGRRDVTFHASVYQLGLGVLALALVVLLKDRIAVWTNVPDVGRYLPPFMLSMVLDRLWFMPERLLVRDMRFRTVALARSAGDAAYTAVSVLTALLGWGGMAIAAGNVARSALKAAWLISAVDPREWLTPSRLRRDTSLAMLKFGLPLVVGAIAGFVATRWDNLLVASFFGPAVMGAYNVAYNLAATAPGVVTDQVVDVLVPSFTRTDARKRAEALVRAASLVALVTMPICFGVAAVSDTLASAFLATTWVGVGPMLAALSIVSAVGPIEVLVLAYMQACDRASHTMVVLLVGMVAVVAAVGTIGRLGPLWSCASIGIAALVCLAVAGLLVRAESGIPLLRLASTHVGPILTCIPMMGAVFGVRALLASAAFHQPYVQLAIEVLVGAAAYCGAAWFTSRSTAADLAQLLRAAFLRASPALVEAPRDLGGGARP